MSNWFYQAVQGVWLSAALAHESVPQPAFRAGPPSAAPPHARSRAGLPLDVILLELWEPCLGQKDRTTQLVSARTERAF